MATTRAARTGRSADSALTPEILQLAGVVVLGAIMTVLDVTIVNVAVPTLGEDFRTSIATIRWVATAYMLAFAAVIPLTGWLSDRFGAKQLWMASLGIFTVGSLLAGVSWSTGSLIAFRVLQGAGGGIIMPLGQTILARVAGPQRMGRVMGVIGIPLFLAPICGPIIGGALVSGASWRWCFYINLPVSVAAILGAIRVLPASTPSRARRVSHYLLSEADRLARAGFPYPGDLVNRGLVLSELGGEGPLLVFSGHIHARATQVAGAVLQFSCASLIEPPHDAAVVEVAADLQEVVRTVRRLGPSGEDPVFAPERERWLWTEAGWEES